MNHFKHFLFLICLVLLFCLNTQQAFSNPGEYFVPHNWVPPNGRYTTPTGTNVVFANGVVLRNFVMRNIPIVGAPPALGMGQAYPFSAFNDLEYSTDAGQTYRTAHVSTNNMLSLTHASDVGSKSFFNSEMLQYDFSVSPLLIRESPILQSVGQHTIEPTTNGGYNVNSFFDVFFEVSIDGGVNWTPAGNSIRFSLYFPPEYQNSSPNYPPLQGKYVDKSFQRDAFFGNGVIIRKFVHDRFLANLPPPPPGGSQIYNFGGRASFELSLDNGLTWSQVSAPTTDAVLVSSPPADVGATRTFNTEMLSLTISGGTLPPTMFIRESPTMASTGKLNIRQDTWNGQFEVSSFFDIFIELSVDGGGTWIPSPNMSCYIELDAQTELDTFQNSKGYVNIQPPTGPPVGVQLAGQTIVLVHIPPEGTASDHNGNGLDDVPIEILSMTLTGTSSMGPVTLKLDGRYRSLGQIEEQVNNHVGTLDVPPFEPTGTATSFFDIFFEVDITGMPPMYGQTSAHMAATITHKPPAMGESYTLVGQSIALVDAQGNPTGVLLLTASHTPIPFLSISGYKWNDFDGNGAWDPGEKGLSGWEIKLDGPIPAFTFTNDTGRYEFSGLIPGPYRVYEDPLTMPPYWLQIYPPNPNGHDIFLDAADIAGGKGKTEVPNFGNFYSMPCPPWTQRYDAKLEGMGFKIPTDAKLMTRNLAVYDNGDVYVCGYGDGRGTKNDYVTIKYDMNGVVKWTAIWNNSAVNKDDKAYALTIDRAGNVYVTGESDFGGSKADIITIKYDAAGNEKWVKRWNGSYNGRDAGYAIALSPDGSKVYVTGETDGSKVQGPNYVTVEYDAGTGVEYWSTTYNGPSSKIDKAYAIAVDPNSGDVVVTGESDGSKADYATIGYDPTLHTQKWVARYDGAGQKDYAFAVKIDKNSNIYVTGASEGSTSKFDYATVKYIGAGTVAWAMRYNNSASKNDYAYDLALDENGNIYVTGASEGAKTGFDYATLKYSPTGAALWANRWEGKKKDIARSIAVCDGSGKVFVTGSSDQGTGRKFDYLTLKIDATTGIKDPAWPGRYNGTGLADDIAYNVALRPGDCCLILTGTSFGGATPKLDLVTIQGSIGAPVPGPITSPPVYTVDEDDEIPNVYCLEQNYPNPFNPTTTIRFNLPEQAIVTLKVFDVLGQEVKTLLDNELLDAGNQETELDANDLASGVYFYRLIAQGMNEDAVMTSNYNSVKKMILLR